MTPCAAWRGELQAFDAHFAAYREALFDTGIVEPDTAWLAEFAGDLLSGAGATARAVAVYGCALDQWRKLGREEEVAQVESKLASAAGQ